MEYLCSLTHQVDVAQWEPIKNILTVKHEKMILDHYFNNRWNICHRQKKNYV